MFRKKKEVTAEDLVTELTKPQGSEDWLADYADEGRLSVDVYQTAHELVVRAPIAGVKPEDVDVTMENGVLTIRGARKDVSEIKEEDYYSKECFWGAFARSLNVPIDVDSSKISATLEDGILTVKLPKLNREKTKVIKIKPTSK